MGEADWLDFDQMLRASQERVTRTQEVRSRLAELSGSAETPDGRVRVRSTATDPLAELLIDPRALRLGSVELAEVIRRTTRAAREDLDRQVAEITAETYGDGLDPSVAVENSAELTKNLTEVQKLFESAGRDIQRVFDQFQQRFAGNGRDGRNSR